MEEEFDPQGERSAFLTVILTIMAGSFIFFFMFIICGGLAVYALMIVGFLAVMGLFHYLLWGHAMDAGVTPDEMNNEDKTQEFLENGE